MKRPAQERAAEAEAEGAPQLAAFERRLDTVIEKLRRAIKRQSSSDT